MSKQPPVSSSTNGAKPEKEKSYFEQQRELLVRDVAASMEQVLQNINKLNRSLEGIVAVGSEFSSVEALWSHFENVMAKDPNVDTEGEADGENREQTEDDDNDDAQTQEQSHRKPGMGKMR